MPNLRTFLALIVLLAVSGCGGPYDPPIAGDHASGKYKADLEACRKSSEHAVYINNAGSPGTWIISPITGPSEVRGAIRGCMQGKGYVLEKAGG